MNGESATRPAAHIPVLRNGDLSPEMYARSTCFEAGYLVSKNAGWRNVRPVVDATACTGCLQCYLYCPDGTVFKTGAPGKRRTADGSALDVDARAAVAIDYDFCKGCGVCAKVCTFGAIAMISESEALRDDEGGAR